MLAQRLKMLCLTLHPLSFHASSGSLFTCVCGGAAGFALAFPAAVPFTPADGCEQKFLFNHQLVLLHSTALSVPQTHRKPPSSLLYAAPVHTLCRHKNPSELHSSESWCIVWPAALLVCRQHKPVLMWRLNCFTQCSRVMAAWPVTLNVMLWRFNVLPFLRS